MQNLKVKAMAAAMAAITAVTPVLSTYTEVFAETVDDYSDNESVDGTVKIETEAGSSQEDVAETVDTSDNPFLFIKIQSDGGTVIVNEGEKNEQRIRLVKEKDAISEKTVSKINIYDKDDILISNENAEANNYTYVYETASASAVTLKALADDGYQVEKFDISKTVDGIDMPEDSDFKKGVDKYESLLKKRIVVPPLSEQQRIADFLDTKCGILDRTIDAVSQQIEDLEKYKKALITKTVTKGIYKKGEPERAMKDSGVEWIGEVPEEWDVKRNSLNFDIRKTLVGENWSNMQLLSLTTNGVKNITIDDQVGKRPKTLATYQIAHKNDIVMCLFDLDASAVFSGLCKKNGIISPAYKLLKCKNGMFPPYAEYYFRAVFDGRKYKKYAKSIRYTISTNDFMHLKMPVPPLAEQQQIADYLDEKCKNINNRVQKRRQQLEWLKEYKKSLIFDYVTGKKRVEK